MKHIEDNLQIQCVRWFRYRFQNVMMFHLKNGGSLKSAREGARFKAMGVTAGVPDLFVMEAKVSDIGLPGYETTDKHGLFIELKSPKGKQNEAQKDFQIKAEGEGYAYHVCRSFDEFKEVVENYLR